MSKQALKTRIWKLTEINVGWGEARGKEGKGAAASNGGPKVVKRLCWHGGQRPFRHCYLCFLIHLHSEDLCTSVYVDAQVYLAHTFMQSVASQPAPLLVVFYVACSDDGAHFHVMA